MNHAEIISYVNLFKKKVHEHNVALNSSNKTITALQRKRQNMIYTVTVTTSDERNAGTDANVKLTMYGALGDSGKRPLEQRWRDLFERGQTDTFEISCLDMGELDRIKLEHDNKLLKPDWKPLKVVISTGNKYVPKIHMKMSTKTPRWPFC